MLPARNLTLPGTLAMKRETAPRPRTAIPLWREASGLPASAAMRRSCTRFAP